VGAGITGLAREEHRGLFRSARFELAIPDRTKKGYSVPRSTIIRFDYQAAENR
jgi:hypothetical protein